MTKTILDWETFCRKLIIKSIWGAVWSLKCRQIFWPTSVSNIGNFVSDCEREERRGHGTEPVLSNPLSSDKWSWYVNTKCPSHFPNKWLNMETIYFHIWGRISPLYPTYHSIKQAAVAAVEWDCKIRNLLEIKMSMRWYNWNCRQSVTQRIYF